MSVNPFAPIQFVRELLRLMIEQKESHVLNVCNVD
jgi:short-subunit dehydrogenase